jgi:hypothetical protein
MSKSKKSGVGRGDDLPVWVSPRCLDGGEEASRAQPLDRRRVLRKSQHGSSADLTEARARLVFAFLYRLLRIVGSRDAKSLSLLHAAKDTSASEEDQLWLAKIIEQTGDQWPEGFF